VNGSVSSVSASSVLSQRAALPCRRKRRGACAGAIRLYVRIYFALLTGLLVVACLFWAVWRWTATQHERAAFDTYPSSPPTSCRSGRASRRSAAGTGDVGPAHGGSVTLYAPDGELVAHTGDALRLRARSVRRAAGSISIQASPH